MKISKTARQDRRMLLPPIIAAFLLLALIAPLSAKDAGPDVGTAAPEIGPCQWFQREAKVPAEIAKLRGKVVVIHMFAVGCFP